ncbi:Josephin domain containing protein [Asbolus verrucosus]|uniref:Josephin-2 n=1 Tax=Asbolus verrucosus TaxID=1661398 RepID=A0A482WDQ6_ASBVE|nr:Josephin domain containing protein [Asbolus verrucosus]
MNVNDIYHEKQVRELCALHALNNLFQSKDAFTKPELDVICHSLSPDNWINPHKSVLGLGNYDINVIMKALQSRGCETIWFDKRKDPSCLNFKNICGFILNVPSEYKISFITLPLRRRHWITIRQLNGLFYNLDSKLDAPQIIGREPDLLNYLKEELDCRDKELFLVVTNDAGKEQSWLKNQATYSNNIQERDAEVLQLKDIKSDNVNVTINPLCNSKTEWS